jgi:hypothetical protein
MSLWLQKQRFIHHDELEISKRNGIFPDDQLTAALIDRFVYRSHLVVLAGTAGD